MTSRLNKVTNPVKNLQFFFQEKASFGDEEKSPSLRNVTENDSVAFYAK